MTTKKKAKGTSAPIMDALRERRAKDPELNALVEAELAAMRVEDALVKLRTDRGLSQRELATLVRMKQPAIARLEAGRAKNLELRTLVRLASALDARVKVSIQPRRKGPRGHRASGGRAVAAEGV